MIKVNDKIIIGADIGNFNTKTSEFCFPTGVSIKGLGFNLGECLVYEGVNYALKKTSMDIVDDKTTDKRFLVLTLFGITKELIHGGINLCEEFPVHITLAVGLPLNIYGKGDNNKRLAEYYEGEHKYSYKEKQITLFIDKVVVLPQGFPALYSKNYTQSMLENEQWNEFSTPYGYISKNIPKALIVDIGGGTVDIISVIEGLPTTDQYLSFNLGLYNCYAKIDNEIENLRGRALGSISITHYLTKKSTLLNDDEIESINKQINIYIDELLSKLTRNSVSFEDDYILLVGGGGNVVYNALKQRNVIRHLDILADVKANAKGYEELVKRKLLS